MTRASNGMLLWLRQRPEAVAALGSLLLSLIAWLGDPVINRDGMLYISVARQALEQGPGTAMEAFNWPFLPLLLAALSWLTRLDPALLATAFSVVSLLVLSLLAVRICRQLDERLVWPAVVFVLGAPVFNEYRSDLLRDTGAWMMLFASLYLLLLWSRNPDWRKAIGFQLCVAMAVLFRPEMGFLVPATLVWLWVRGGMPALLRDGTHLFAGLGVAGLVGGALLWGAMEAPAARLQQMADVLDVGSRLDAFDRIADRLAESVLNKHSADEAGQILFTGLLSIIPGKWLLLLGIFVVPFFYALKDRPAFSHRPLFLSFNVAFFMVLALFVTWSFYLASRHVAPLALLSMPWVCVGLLALKERFPALGWHCLALVLAAISALDGVISTGPGKAYLREAGEWLATRPRMLEGETYFSDRQVQYYATDFYPGDAPEVSRAEVLGQPSAWRTLVLEVSGAEAEQHMEAWRAAHDFRVERRFPGSRDRAIWVLVRESDQ